MDQEKWNENIRNKVCAALFLSLKRVCGCGIASNHTTGALALIDWEETLKQLAFSSISFPNRHVSLPVVTLAHNTRSLEKKIDGKPHDIEIRAALKLFHCYKSKKRRRNENAKSQKLSDDPPPLEVISDMGLVRTINSPLELANLICISMEAWMIDDKDVPSSSNIHEICADVRPDRSGLICIVTKWRSLSLRKSGKLPCPSCIKWCKGMSYTERFSLTCRRLVLTCFSCIESR